MPSNTDKTDSVKVCLTNDLRQIGQEIDLSMDRGAIGIVLKP